MPDTGPDTQTATTYPNKELYGSWRKHANELDLTISKFITKMVEAGRKNISIGEASSEALHSLNQQNTDLQRELRRQRERVNDLERRLEQTAANEIIDFVHQNPGATTPEIIQHVANTVPVRVVSYLDLLEGDAVQNRDGSYYPQDDSTAPKATTEPHHGESD